MLLVAVKVHNLPMLYSIWKKLFLVVQIKFYFRVTIIIVYKQLCCCCCEGIEHRSEDLHRFRLCKMVPEAYGRGHLHPADHCEWEGGVGK